MNDTTQPSPTPHTCPDCGTTLTPDNEPCHICGHTHCFNCSGECPFCHLTTCLHDARTCEHCKEMGCRDEYATCAECDKTICPYCRREDKTGTNHCPDHDPE